VHSGTAQSPFARFTDNLQCIRSAPQNLNDYIRNCARCRVAKDRSITLKPGFSKLLDKNKYTGYALSA
jgi:hypothetical protein